MINKSCIYYTDNEIGEPINTTVQNYIELSGLPIVSVSLKPMEFGNPNVLISDQKRGYRTMIRQIRTALEFAGSDYVFFCEHDVLYPQSHFDFTPPRDDIFYYNKNVWRWQFGSRRAIRYERMLPLSVLCVNRELALEHYLLREKAIREAGEEAFNSREPIIARKWGYEPGTKKKKRGGLTNDDFDTWSSEEPVIDIRHKGTFSPAKTTLESFKHLPLEWEEINVEDIPGWDLQALFNL